MFWDLFKTYTVCKTASPESSRCLKNGNCHYFYLISTKFNFLRSNILLIMVEENKNINTGDQGIQSSCLISEFRAVINGEAETFSPWAHQPWSQVQTGLMDTVGNEGGSVSRRRASPVLSNESMGRAIRHFKSANSHIRKVKRSMWKQSFIYIKFQYHYGIPVSYWNIKYKNIFC